MRKAVAKMVDTVYGAQTVFADPENFGSLFRIQVAGAKVGEKI